MATSGEVVREVRASTGLSVRTLAKRAGVAPSTVHRIETGALDPTMSTLSKVVQGAGADLVVSVELDPTSSVAALGSWIRTQADHDETVWPVRHAAGLVARVRATRQYAPLRWVEAAPSPTGDSRWDCFLAALADWIADSEHCARPAWTGRPDRFLDEAWWVTPMTSMKAWEYAGSPAAFRHRGIYLHRDSLVNV